MIEQDGMIQDSGPSPRSTRGGILVGIQYLRAIAAIAVVVFHAAQRAGMPFWVGEAGVDLFFLLSGFLMLAITEAGSRPLPFLRDRLRRIVPPYWIATSVVLAGASLGLFPQMQVVPWHVVSSYLFIPSISPYGRPWPLLVPGWTLNFEMFFYLCFALTMALRSQTRQVAVLALVFGAAVAVGMVLRPANAIGATYTDPMLLEFVGGMAIGLWWKRSRALPAWIGWLALLIAAVLFVGVWTLHTDRPRVIIFGLPSVLALIGVLVLERRQRIGRSALPLLLGNASYSIYLWHTLAISLAVKACALLHLPRFAIVPVGIASGLAAGVLGYWLIERPLLKLFRARRQRHGVTIPAGP